MAHYRKIDARIWNDAKFRGLSKDGKLVFLFVLTHPNLTMLGAMRGTVIGLATELHSQNQGLLEGFQQALVQPYADGFMEAHRKGMVKADERACLIWLPNFLKYNRPESPNVVKAWATAFDLLPECPLKHEVFGVMKETEASLTEGFRKAFAYAFAKGMPIQEQEQEQELKTQSASTDVLADSSEQGSSAALDPVVAILPLVGEKTYEVRKREVEKLELAYPHLDIRQQLRNMESWLDSNPRRRKKPKGIKRFMNAWLTNEKPSTNGTRPMPKKELAGGRAANQDGSYKL